MSYRKSVLPQLLTFHMCLWTQTNNPRKMSVLRALGVVVTDRVPCIVKAQEFSESYLAVKAARMDHVLEGDFCYWNHDGEPVPSARLSSMSESDDLDDI